MNRTTNAWSHHAWWTAEAIAWTLGVVCVATAAFRYIDATTHSREAVRRFTELQAAGQVRPSTTDVALWSTGRIIAWRQTWTLPAQPPLAVLRIPRIGLEVPVLGGTDDVTLDRGSGHIEGTAAPGTDGNSGIAGHRDGFFRGLKDVIVGDAIELDTLQGKQVYRIERTWIVNPDDVSVLDPTPGQALTLVTCYPFYFVGSAPQRFIVRAVRAEPPDTPSLTLAHSTRLRW